MSGRARLSPLGKAPLHLDLQLRGLPLLDGVEFVKTLDEQKVSNLFDYGERV
jgi:hypothetical protein